MLITPAADLAFVTGSDVVGVPLAASPRPGGTVPAGAPAEAWAHLAVYRARPDAAAIARAQPASAFAVAATVTLLVPLYGQAAWLGESVPVYDDAALLRSSEQAERAAGCLPTGEALLLPLSDGEIASWRAVGGELLPRLWQHLRRRSGVGFVGPDPGKVQG